MKPNIFLLLITSVLSFTQCGRNDETIQKIDQITQIYIDSLGQDMLNKQLPNSYQTISLNDVYGSTDVAPITYQLIEDTENKYFLQYIAGANRLQQNSSENTTSYQSKIALNMTKIVNGKTITVNDTLILDYENTPELFQLKNAYYNNQLVFTKTIGQSNIIKIVK